MKRLTDAEIADLAVDELQDYSAYLKRVEAHEKGAGTELRRIRAELTRRGKPVQRVAEPMNEDELLAWLTSPESGAEIQRMMEETAQQVEEIFGSDFSDDYWLR